MIGAAVGLSACQSLDHTQNAISTTKTPSTQAEHHDIYTQTLKWSKGHHQTRQPSAHCDDPSLV